MVIKSDNIIAHYDLTEYGIERKRIHFMNGLQLSYARGRHTITKTETKGLDLGLYEVAVLQSGDVVFASGYQTEHSICILIKYLGELKL